MAFSRAVGALTHRTVRLKGLPSLRGFPILPRPCSSARRILRAPAQAANLPALLLRCAL